MDFAFDNSQEFNILSVAQDNISVKIHRCPRHVNHPGMSQPVSRRTVIGWGAKLTVLKDGRPDTARKWKLKAKGRIMDKGVTDKDGISHIDIKLRPAMKYSLTLL